MIVLAGLVLGAVFGGWRAARAGGKGLDIAQYAAAHGLAFMLVGLFATILIDRLAG